MIQKPVIQKLLGLSLSNMTNDLRSYYKIKDTVRGVVITEVDAQSSTAGKGLKAGEVIVEVSGQQVNNTDDLQKRLVQLKNEGRESVLLRVASAGFFRFVGFTPVDRWWVSVHGQPPPLER